MHIRRSRRHRMNQLGPTVYANMSLHPEIPLVALLRLVHLWIPLLGAILRRTGGTDDGRIHNRASVDHPPLCGQIGPNPRKELFSQFMSFQEMPKLQIVVSSGTGSRPKSMPTNCRMARESYSASSTAGSDRLNHCCRQ